MDEKTTGYLLEKKRKYSLEQIRGYLDKVRGAKVLVIGDTIMDEYHFTSPKGRAMKDPILSVDYISHEVYAGGILAIANHLSSYLETVHVLSVVGDRMDRREDIKELLAPNIRTTFFVKANSPTTTKLRFINYWRNEKLFKVEYINDKPVSPELERELTSYLEQELPKYDLVVVGDFGHGFINDRMVHFLELHSNFLVVNCQTNSSNLGFNYVTKYHNPHYITMDVPELQYAVNDRFTDIPGLMAKFSSMKRVPRFLVTASKAGSFYFAQNRVMESPVFVSRPVDTVGAGDAVFAVTSLLVFAHAPDDLIPFIGNCVGGVKVQYMGNKESVTRERLLGFIEELYLSNGEQASHPADDGFTKHLK